MLAMCYNATKVNLIDRRPTSEVTYTDNRTNGIEFPHLTICDSAGFWKSYMKGKHGNTWVCSIEGKYLINY